MTYDAFVDMLLGGIIVFIIGVVIWLIRDWLEGRQDELDWRFKCAQNHCDRLEQDINGLRRRVDHLDSIETVKPK